MGSNIEAMYRFSDFVRDYIKVNEVETIDYEFLVRKYFDGELDDLFKDVEFEAVDFCISDSEIRLVGESEKLMPALMSATRHCLSLARGIFNAYANLHAEQFMRMLESVLQDRHISDRLDALTIDTTIAIEDRMNIARVRNYDFNAVIEGRDEFRTDAIEDAADAESRAEKMLHEHLADIGINIRWVQPDGSTLPVEALPRISKEAFGGRVVNKLLQNDPDFFKDIARAHRLGNEPAVPRTRMTVAEARKHLVKHTGQSERAVIRQTRGWDAKKIIGLIV